MGVATLREDLPDYAKDLRLNLGSVTSSTTLTEQQLWGTVLVAAIASRGRTALAELADEADGHLSEVARRAARSAAAVMAMNNVYYRALHLLGDATGAAGAAGAAGAGGAGGAGGGYDHLPARLRMNVMANPGVDKVDFELWSLAVSAVNGCGRCLESHERELRSRGVRPEVVQDAIRVAAVVHAVAVTLESEENLPLSVAP
jgi:lipoyl-dependent peroxiredoxin subunit D